MHNLLCKLTPEVLQAAALLFAEPLYQGAEKGEIHVLFASRNSSADEKKVLDTIFYMSMRCLTLDHTLHLHIVSDRADGWKTELLSAAPALPDFISLDGRSACEAPLLHLTFEGWDAFDHRLAQCGFIIADRQTALHICEKEIRRAILVHTGTPFTSACRDIRPVSLEAIKGADEILNQLGEMAFRQHYFYAQQYNACASAEEERAYFIDHAYEQLANLPSVVHTKYKFWSVGIDPDSPPGRIAESYGKILDDPMQLDRLTLLEHNLWMVGKLLDGYRPAASAEELDTWCFTADGNNNKWRIDGRKVHNCLLTARPDSRLNDLSHADWDGFTPETIEASPFDDLDKMSLLVHFLGRQKLPELKTELENATADLPDFISWTGHAVRGAELWKKDLWLTELKNKGLPVPTLKLAETFGALCVEVWRYKNYREIDSGVVRLAGELYCKPNSLSIIKLPCSQIVDHIAAALLIEPQKIIFLGKTEEEACHLRAFFENRGGVTQTAFAEPSMENIMALIRKESAEGFCTVDITGSEAGLALKIADFVRDLPNAAIISCDSRSQKIENLLNFPLAGAIKRQAHLRVDEVFALFGARRKEQDAAFNALLLGRHIEDLWSFFQKYHAELKRICPIMQAAARQTCINDRRIDAVFRISMEELEIDKASINRKLFEGVLKTLQNSHLIHDLTCTEEADKLHITFTFSHEAVYQAFEQRGNFLEYKIWAALREAEIFDDVQSSFFFQLDDITNELDVVCVSGLDLHLFSCKFTKPQKEHLFEVAGLAHQFSHNSRACMVYAFDSCKVKDWTYTFARAEKMGIRIANALDDRAYTLEDMLDALKKT